jgi:glycosyltransferase involved in cell wall biosynthesis
VRIAHFDTGRTWRGGQAQALHLLRGLARRGHTCLLLAPRGPLLERAAETGAATVPWRPLGEWDALAVVRAASALRRFHPDVAHCHSAHAHALGVLAARLAGVPAVVVSRRVDFAVATHPASRLKYAGPVDRYLCISRGVIEVMRRAGIPDARLALVPSGVELPERAAGPRAGSRPDLRALLGIAGDTPVFGTVAALAPHKDHANLLRAAARVVRQRADAHFAWIGEGECRPALERARRSLGLETHVHLMGFREDALELLAQFDVFALSSYLEGLCTSLLDAQALGIPIVATAVGGIPDIVEPGRTGRLVPSGDPQALARTLLEAIEHPEESRRMAERARETVRAFTVDRMVERTIEEYEAVLVGRGRTT